MSSLRIGSSAISGRGVFAERAFAAGDVVEECPMLRIPRSELEHVQRTVLRDYLFSCDDGSGDIAIALGCGSLYNHSDEPNATYRKDGGRNVITFVAERDIRAGEEVTVAYQRVWLMDGRRPGSEPHGPYLGPSGASDGPR